MKKLFTLTMIMLLVFSLVLVSCNANPNENKNTDGDSSQTQTPQTEISEKQKTLLKKRYSDLLPTVASIAEISDMKQEAGYTEQRNITIKPTANSDEGFVLLSDDELEEYNKIADPEKETETPVASPATVMVTASEDGGAMENDPSTETEDEEDALKIIEKAMNYAEFGFEMEYENEPVEEEGVEPADATTFSLKNTSFVLKVKLDGETDFVEYDDSSENDNLSISASTMMEEYQALLNIQKKEGTEITMNSFIVKKLLSLVREYKPEINVDTTFGKDKEGRLTADVVLSYEKDGVIKVTVKSAEVSLKDQTVIELTDAVFNVTLGEDFNVKATLTSFTSPDDMTELMVDFSSLTIEGGVSVAFENVKLDVPVVLTDSTINFSFVVTGNGGYNFTTTQITVDNITVSDMMTWSEFSELINVPALADKSGTVSFLTLGFSYSGKLSDLDLASGKEGLGKFLEGFKVTMFAIASVPVNTEYVNKFMSDNWEKIYDAVQNYLDSVGNDESEILYRG